MLQQDTHTTDAEKTRRRATESESQIDESPKQNTKQDKKKSHIPRERPNVWKEEYAPW